MSRRLAEIVETSTALVGWLDYQLMQSSPLAGTNCPQIRENLTEVCISLVRRGFVLQETSCAPHGPCPYLSPEGRHHQPRSESNPQSPNDASRTIEIAHTMKSVLAIR